MNINSSLGRPFLTFLTWVLVALLSACGGGGGNAGDGDKDATPPITVITPNPAPFAGTAHEQLRRTILYDGKDYGFAREGAQALVDFCNSYRTNPDTYNLPATSPSGVLMHQLDVETEEKFFDTNKALTVITHKSFVLTDFARWNADLAAGRVTENGLPAVAPDCSLAELTEYMNGTLWRDGRNYDMRYSDKKAVGQLDGKDAAPPITNAEFLSLPSGLFLGQSCHQIGTPASQPPLDGGGNCVWDRFPYQTYLNWPFTLGLKQWWGFLNNGAVRSIQTVELLEVDTNKGIPSETFEIPKDFVVVEIN